MIGTIRKIVSARKREAAKYAGFQVDLEKSNVYASQWGIFFSPETRSSPGHEEMKRKLREELRLIRSPSGYTVFEQVYLREELFQGEFLERFPDLIPIPSPRFLVNPILFDKIFDARIDRPYLKGSHKSDPNGIFILWGDGVTAEADLGTVGLTDIAPTVLSLFGFSPPEDMDGKIIGNAFSRDFSARRPTQPLLSTPEDQEPKERRGYSEEEQEQITEQLRRLGYV